jgi:hypothetical protein
MSLSTLFKFADCFPPAFCAPLLLNINLACVLNNSPGPRRESATGPLRDGVLIDPLAYEKANETASIAKLGGALDGRASKKIGGHLQLAKKDISNESSLPSSVRHRDVRAG